MLDYKIKTFLSVCKTLNYRKTSELLHMSQPSVTQHIQGLESYYNKRLFIYNGRKIQKTKYAAILEKYTISQVQLEKEIEAGMNITEENKIRFGATKTIGNFVIKENVEEFLKQKNNTAFFIIDNTKNLTSFLKENKIDAALIEGHFDKDFFDYRLFRKEAFVGICQKGSNIDGKVLTVKDLAGYPLIIREPGSGTRAILEMAMAEHSLSLNMFGRTDVISSFDYITDLVEVGRGISFVYQSVLEKNKNLGHFTVKDASMAGEFNLVYPKNCKTDSVEQIWKLIKGELETNSLLEQN